MFSRRRFLYAGVAAAGIGAIGGDGFVRSEQVIVKRFDIPLQIPEAFDGFTIAQLSDLHYDDYFSAVPIRKAVKLVNELLPDVIALTGDFVTVPVVDYRSHRARLSAKSIGPCADIVGRLQAREGKFAILGNHDAGSDPGHIVSALRGNGIPVLMNRSVAFERGKFRIWLSGVDDVLEGRPDLGAALRTVPAGEAVVLMAHEPDFADESSLAPVQLQLSGHSHGGQVWIPGIGAPWLPPLARKYPRGLNQVGKMKLYTNLGIGTIRMPVRLNCPPEVTLITLRSAHV